MRVQVHSAKVPLLSPESKGASAPRGRFVGELPGFSTQWPKNTESNGPLTESHTLLLVLKTTSKETYTEAGTEAEYRLRKSLNS